jgi:hypothetical protein
LGVSLWVKTMGTTRDHSCSHWSRGTYQRTYSLCSPNLPFIN